MTYKVGDVVEATWKDPDDVTHGVAATITGAGPVLTADSVAMCGLSLPDGEVVILEGDDVVDCEPCLADKWDLDLGVLLATDAEKQFAVGRVLMRDAILRAFRVPRAMLTLTERRKRWLFR